MNEKENLCNVMSNVRGVEYNFATRNIVSILIPNFKKNQYNFLDPNIDKLININYLCFVIRSLLFYLYIYIFKIIINLNGGK